MTLKTDDDDDNVDGYHSVRARMVSRRIYHGRQTELPDVLEDGRSWLVSLP